MSAPDTTNPSDKWALRRALLRFYGRRLGWGGLAGLLLIIIALIFELTVVAVTRQQAAVAGQQIEALRRQSADRSLARVPAPAEPGFFPRRQALAMAIERIHALAEEHGLAHGSGEYQALPSAVGQSGGLLRYRLTLPLQGPYPAWRNWLGAVMNEMPAVALSEFQLKRGSVGSSVVETQVRLTLYFEAP